MKHFWADLHLDQGETLITQLGRPAASPEDWCELCIEGINRSVAKGDILYLLGDFAFKRPGYWRQKIKCQCFLIRGNHDPNITKLKNVFGGNIASYKLVKCCNVKTALFHYPMCFWDASHRGGFHLYGHIHNHQLREYVMDQFMPGRRSLDVSPESSLLRLGELRPFSEDDVYGILSRRSGHDQIDYVVPERL